MPRGQFRVYLGSAPGVGKTYRMLDEGWRRRQRGTDVVIGYVETHHRPNTDAQLRDLEIVPRISREYRGTQLEEMDVDAILARKPTVVLVDELAHTNAPGSRHEKRWQDVDELLDAGIDVITTVNIQHLESVNDVVQKITGITQLETVPDAVVRRADQIELVDVTPEALRRRMAHGNIYTADKIDTSLSNYFRVGNLSALRELALLWLADRVEDALQRYQDDNEISATWETRERLIVGVTGSQGDEILLRRAARIASRTGAEILAVHVKSADGIHRGETDTSLARELVVEFEGKFQEIVDDNIATALVAFARAERGTQIVLGASRPRSALRPLGGVVENVLRHTTDLDVHVIAVGDERPAHVHARRRLQRLSWPRRAAVLAAAAVTMPLLTVILASARSDLSVSSEFLAYLVLVLALATWGGVFVGVVAALAAFGLENYYFVKPLHTLVVSRPDDVVALVAYLVFAVGASVLVNRFSRRSHQAERARAEAQVLAQVVATVGTSHDDLLPLLDALRAVFDATGVAIRKRVDDVWSIDVVSGEPLVDDVAMTSFPIDEDYSLDVAGVSLDLEDRQLINAFAGRIAASLRAVSDALEANEFRALARVEAVRTGLLRVVSGDVGESLASIRVTVSTLLDGVATAPARVQRERLIAVESEIDTLVRLIDNLVDLGRLEEGTLTPRWTSASMNVLVTQALESVETERRTLDVDVVRDLPSLETDVEIARRAITLVVERAVRSSAAGETVRITAGVERHTLELLVIDRGAGLDAATRASILDPLRRFGDPTGDSTMGLRVAAGFVDLVGGRLRFEDTPGCGLTVGLAFPLPSA